jgi:hypothetical protein
LAQTRDARSVVNTPAGLFWMSPEQGKIFTVTGNGLMDIAMPENSWWFARYLPYRIFQDFPNFNLIGNPYIGVICQTVYDSENGIVYFTKRDYKLKSNLNLPTGQHVEFSHTPVTLMLGQDAGPSGHFALYQEPLTRGGVRTLLNVFEIGDTTYFEDVSWTVSYDIGAKKWLSYHDWNPDLVMPSKRTFNTIKGVGIWRHNERCDKFCNYYGVDYPWEVEYEYNTGVAETTLRSLEYNLEVYKYGANCVDRYLYLDENFDEAVIFNNEQCSGLLKLFIRPWDDPRGALLYPKFNLENVEILYSRVENKYRINMFSDLTDDRGQFSNARRNIWITKENGYVKTLNPVNLNYQKPVFQQKRFRGYVCSVFLRRKVCDDKKFLLLFAQNKVQESKR